MKKDKTIYKKNKFIERFSFKYNLHNSYNFSIT